MIIWRKLADNEVVKHGDWLSNWDFNMNLDDMKKLKSTGGISLAAYPACYTVGLAAAVAVQRNRYARVTYAWRAVEIIDDEEPVISFPK